MPSIVFALLPEKGDSDLLAVNVLGWKAACGSGRGLGSRTQVFQDILFSSPAGFVTLSHSAAPSLSHLFPLHQAVPLSHWLGGVLWAGCKPSSILHVCVLFLGAEWCSQEQGEESGCSVLP